MKTAKSNIAVLRKAGFKLQDIADKLKVSLMTVWRWENQPPKNFNLSMLKKLEKMAVSSAKKMERKSAKRAA
jgi:transcriptional regulator with XRE-family HTH domain